MYKRKPKGSGSVISFETLVHGTERGAKLLLQILRFRKPCSADQETAVSRSQKGDGR